MVTGKIPFESDNPVALAVKHIEEAPPAPRRYNPSIPPALESIILKTLSKDPAQRFPSAVALANALRNLESQSEMGTMAVLPTPPVRPSRNQYGNNEIYNLPVQRTPYPQQPVQNSGQVVRPNQVPPVYYGATNDYRDPSSGLNNSQGVRTNQVRPAGYSYDSQTYRRGQVPASAVEDDFEEQRSSGPGWGAWLIGILAFIALAALIIVGILVVPSLLTSQQTPVPTAVLPTATLAPAAQVSVPNVVGKAETDARKLITDAKLEVGDESQEFNSKVSPGSVISQDPPASQMVNSGTKIRLVVSKGQELVNLPDYVNRDGKQAADALTQLGFQVQVINQPDPKIQANAVIKTDPAGGTDKNYPKGSIIKLYVSSGQPTPTPAPQPTATPVPVVQPTATSLPQPTATPVPAVKVDVPDVFNMPQNQAVQILQKAGFKVEVRLWTIDDVKKFYPNDPGAQSYFDSAKPGDVIGMQPGPTDRDPGLQQPKGSTITIGVKKP